MNKTPILETRSLCRSYRDGAGELTVLRSVDCTFYPKELAAIFGPSGSGKSTLLHCLSGLDQPTRGQVFWQGRDPFALNESARCEQRGQLIGFVYQFHHLLSEFTALENVMLPALISKKESISLVKEKAENCLASVGLSDRLQHKPAELSGGERQRAAIARALINDPSCVLADEPTGNLDPAAALKFYELVLSLNEQYQTAFVIVTHDQRATHFVNKVYQMEAGQLVLD